MATTMQPTLLTHDLRTSPLAFYQNEQEHIFSTAANNHSFQDMHRPSAAFPMPSQLPTTSGSFSYQADNVMTYDDNYSLTYPLQLTNSACPRSYNTTNLSQLEDNNNLIAPSYPPTAYQIEPHQQNDAMDLADTEIRGQLMQMDNDYDHFHFEPNVKQDDFVEYRSPYSDLTRASTPQSGSGGEDCAIDKEQPYAQLIYHALMNAPEKTMVLRDIYEWFKQNTDKASGSETKGWQNSIRHNLSMNGVSCVPGFH